MVNVICCSESFQLWGFQHNEKSLKKLLNKPHVGSLIEFFFLEQKSIVRCKFFDFEADPETGFKEGSFAHFGYFFSSSYQR